MKCYLSVYWKKAVLIEKHLPLVWINRLLDMWPHRRLTAFGFKASLCVALLSSVATMVEVVVSGSRGAQPIGLCICSRWQEDIVFAPSFFFSFFFLLALTSQPWLTWFVVAPRSEGGSWIMSSYSLRGGPRLVDYRIALTDQRELWLLSNSPHKER